MFSIIVVHEFDLEKTATLLAICASLFTIVFGIVRMMKQDTMLNHLRTILLSVKKIENNEINKY